MFKFFFVRFVELTSHPRISKLLKGFSQSRLSSPLVKAYAKVYDLDSKEMEHPITHYKTIHELFTRHLNSNARPIHSEQRAIISPVDGVISTFGEISPEQTFYIKKQFYSLKEMLGQDKRAKKYADGSFMVIYLSPSHYHRFHYPVTGEVTARYALGERSYPVNSLGEKWGKKPFSSNYRIISELHTEQGNVSYIKVGALNINSIVLTNASSSFKKGEELGYFSFGSTVILIFEKSFKFESTVKENSEIKTGSKIGITHALS